MARAPRRLGLVETRGISLRSLVERGRVARDVVRTTGVLGKLNPQGVATLATRAVRRTLPKGPTVLAALHAAHRPTDEALVDDDLRLDWRAFDERVDRLARALLALGVRRGDRVALMLRNGHRYLLAQWALLRIGAPVVQIGYRLKAAEVAHVLGNAEPALVIHEEDFDAVVREAIRLSGARPRCGTLDAPRGFDALAAQEPRPELRPDGDGASAGVMIYTSGTTGRPKGASRTFEKSLHDCALDFVRQVGVTTDERHLVVCPLYHSAAPAFVTLTWLLGGAVILRDHFDPEDVLRTIERERVTSAFMVPTLYTRLAALPEEVRRRYDLSSLRWLMSGAAALPTETARRIEAWIGPKLYNFYGATETGLVTLALPGEHVGRPGTIGRPLLGVEVRLLDERGRDVPRGEVGEIYVRSTMLVAGYHRDREATSKAMRDGFFSVGDMGRVDEAGYYYLADRKTDMVISGGVNIYPLEIEQHLHTHPEVLEAAVVGVPDPEWGESLKAFVVRRDGATVDEQDVQRWCKQALADYKCPRQIVFLDALPRNPTGKILKRELR